MKKLIHKEKRLFVAVALAFALLLAACSLGTPGKAFASAEASSVDDPVQVAQIEQQAGERQDVPSVATLQAESGNTAVVEQTTVGSATGDQEIVEPSSSPAPTPDSAAKPEQTTTASNDEAGSEPTQPTDPSKLTGFVIVSGNTKVGTTLVAGAEGAPEGVSLAYQWYCGESAIPGATTNAYTTTIADNGKDITCRVSAAGYEGVLVSGSIRPTAPAAPQAFAVYCDEDKSLNFYKRSYVPNVGDTFAGKMATAVYTGIETTSYNAESVPWAEYARTILSVQVADDGIAPVSTAYWFYVFNACTSLDVVRLDTSNVIDMTEMFDACCSLPLLDVSHFDTSRVTSMAWMFASCELLVDLDLSSWDTSSVTDMTGMFNYSYALSELRINTFNTSNVTTMLAMFEGCQELKTLNLLGWDTSNVIDMGEMFCDCSALTTLDLSGFDLSNVTDMHSMFACCPSLVTVYVAPGADWSGIFGQSMYMFDNCPALVGGLGTAFENEKHSGIYACIDGLVGKPGYFTPKITVSYFDPAAEMLSAPVQYVYGLKAAESELEGFWGWALTPNATSPVFLPSANVLYDPTNIADIVLYPVMKPMLTGYVVLTGSTKVGVVLVATVEDAPEDAVLIYQWYRGTNPISGAISNTYTTTQDDNGQDLTCKVQASGYQGVLVSGAIRPFTPVVPAQNITVEYWGYTDASPEAQVLLKSEIANLTDIFDYKYDQNFDTDKTNDRVAYKLLGWQAEGMSSYYDASLPENEFSTTLQDIAALVGWNNDAPLVFHAVQEVRQITVIYELGGYENEHDFETIQVMSWFDIPYIAGLKWDGYQFLYECDIYGNELDDSMTCGYILTELMEEPWSDELYVLFDWTIRSYVVHFIAPNGANRSGSYLFWSEIEPPTTGLAFEYPGHEFVGWFTELDGAGMQVFADTKYCDIEQDDQVESRNLYAYFTQLDLTGVVRVSGNANAGDTLTATVEGVPADACLQYRWYRGGTLIPGAIETTYALTNEDVGANISCCVTDVNYKGSLLSNIIGPIGGLDTQAFAVYSDADNSLRFYKRASVPVVSEIFENRVVTALYIEIEASAANAKWKDYASAIKSVVVVDSGIQPASISKWFEGLANCTYMDLLKLNTSKVKTMSYVFGGCSSLTHLDVSGFDTSNVTMMSGMFAGCSKLTSLDISAFDTSQLISMTRMFQDCSSLAQLSLPTSSMLRLKGLVETFKNCTSLFALDLSGIVPANGYNALRMCEGCTALTTIYAAPDADWSGISAIDSSEDLFSNCPALVGGGGTEFDPNNVDVNRACIDGLNGKPGYFTAKPVYDPEKRESAGEAHLFIQNNL